jgi:hypothetical protein
VTKPRQGRSEEAVTYDTPFPKSTETGADPPQTLAFRQAGA